MSRPYRYAIYFCPQPGSALGRFGADWLGNYKMATAMALSDDVYLAVTKSPRRYGFHGTLKAPFQLSPLASQEQLLDAVSALATSTTSFAIDGFVLKSIGSFIALVPRSEPDELSILASRCVTELDTFRAPPDSDELTRRRRANLSPAQDQLLVRWGYPYVLDEFRFHLTLTEKMNRPERDHLIQKLSDQTDDALGPYQFDDICVFTESEPGADFELLHRHPLRG